MPSKRTNDSVDRILAELGREQAAASVRNSVNDHQVDDILRSLDIATDTSVLLPEGTPAAEDSEVDALLADLPSLQGMSRPAAPAAPQPARPAQPGPAARPAQQSAPRTAPTAERPNPAPQPAPAPRPAATQQPAPTPSAAPVQQQTPPPGDTVGDTTRTGIIKNFLLKMAPEGVGSDTQMLNAGKNQFQKFFSESAAVVPDEKGRIRETGRKKRGFLGLSAADETEDFVPINVSLSGSHEEQPPQEEYYPDEEPEQTPRPAPKKRGGLFGLFGSREDDTMGGLEVTGAPAELPAPPAEPPAPAPATPRTQPAGLEQDGTGVYRSKYTANRRAQALPDPAPFTEPSGSITLSGSTLELLRSAVTGGKAAPASAARSSLGNTGTVYRKKRDTVEFTPRKKKAPQPPPAAETRVSEPVGELLQPEPEAVPAPVNTYTSTGFTVQMDPQNPFEPDPMDSTRDFLEAFNAVYPHVEEAPRAASAPVIPTVPPVAPAVPAEPETWSAQPAPEEQGWREDTGWQQEDGDVSRTITGQIKLDVNAQSPTPEAPAAPAQPPTSDFVNNIAESINAQPTAQVPDLSRYEEAAANLLGTADLPEPEEDTSLQPKRPAGRVRLTGRPEDEEDDAAAQPFTEELPSLKGGPRYDTADDAPRVRRALEKQVFRQTVLSIVTGVIALVLIYLGTAATGKGLPMPAPLDPATSKSALLGTMLALLLAAAALNWQTLFSGFKGLAAAPTADSMPALAALGAVIQLAVFLAAPIRYDPASLCLLAGPAALLLCFNSIGKALDACSTRDSFSLVSARVDHAVAYRLKDAGTLRAVTRGLAEPRPCVLVSRPTQLFKSFLPSASARRTSDKNQQQFAWALGLCALLSLVITLIRDKDPAKGVTAMAAVLALGAPLAGTLLSALPARLMQRSAAQVGAVVPGWKDIRQLGRINVIQVTARDLFPAGCVTLSGINPVYKERIDLAIVYAASVLSEESSVLRDIFLGMIGNDSKLLAKVDDRETVYGKGYIGWVRGERVMVGNRALMTDYGIQLPSLEYEQRHTVNQRRVIYLAVSGKLFAMFQVAYQRDPDTAAVLDSLRRSGLSLLVDCDDFNVDVALLEAAYSLPAGAVKVLDGSERETLAPATAWLPESEGNMLHLGSFASFVGGLEAAAGAAEGEHKAAMVMSASVLFSCLLSLIMAFSAGLAGLAVPYVVLYQAAWAVLSLLFPLLQRY